MAVSDFIAHFFKQISMHYRGKDQRLIWCAETANAMSKDPAIKLVYSR